MDKDTVNNPPDQLHSYPGPWFNIKMVSYQYRKSHCGDKTVVRSSYLHSWISYTGKMSSLYWMEALDVERNLLPCMIRRRVLSSFGGVVSNRCPISPLLRLLLSRTQHRTFEMAPCDIPVVIDNPIWESPRSENRAIISIITSRILFDMILPLWFEKVVWMRST